MRGIKDSGNVRVRVGGRLAGDGSVRADGRCEVILKLIFVILYIGLQHCNKYLTST